MAQSAAEKRRMSDPAYKEDILDKDFSRKRPDRHFRHCSLAGTNLVGAFFSEIDLSDSDLRGINAVEADLSRAKLHAADLRGGDLTGANCAGAGFFWADLEDVCLRGANLCGANLEEAHLYRTTDLRGATYDQHTRWPEHIYGTGYARFDPKRAGAKFVGQRLGAWGRILLLLNRRTWEAQEIAGEEQ